MSEVKKRDQALLWPFCLYLIDNESADGRTRTGKGVTSQQILSLLCLPFHHIGVGKTARLV